MNKKFFVFFGILLCIIFSFTFCFAENNDGLKRATNDVRNFIGGVEDTVENGAKDISNVSKDATGSVENGLDNNMKGLDENAGYTSSDSNGGQYTASRVATDDSTLMGMTSTAWTWLIIGIAAIAIIAVVWYYSMQFTNSSNHDDDRLD